MEKMPDCAHLLFGSKSCQGPMLLIHNYPKPELSITISGPPADPLQSPSQIPSENTFSSASHVDQQQKHPIFSSGTDLDSRPEKLLYYNIQPLVVSDTMSHLNKPWGVKSPRAQVLEYTYLEVLTRSMLRGLLRRYGRSSTGCSGLTRAMNTQADHEY
jgi:hypothetical protein